MKVTDEQVDELLIQAERIGYDPLDYANLYLGMNGRLTNIRHLDAEQADWLLMIMKSEATAIETMDNEKP